MSETRPSSKLFQRVRRGLTSSLNSSADESSDEDNFQLLVPERKKRSAEEKPSSLSDEMKMLAMRLENGFQGSLSTSTVKRCRSAGATTSSSVITTSGSTTEEVSSIEGSDNEMDRQFRERSHSHFYH